jgi:hypothetical protein
MRRVKYAGVSGMNGIKLFSKIFLALLLMEPVASAQVTKDALDQNADQAQGNYTATNLNYLGSGSLGMMQSAWKDPLQHMGEGQTHPGYTKYYWTPELVLPIRLREGMYTLINFPSWEMVEHIYLGDSVSFNAVIEGPSSIMVYPEASQFVGVDTNMIVFGRSGNKYVFYVQSETVNTDRITNAIIDIDVVDKKQKEEVINGNGSGFTNSGNSSSDNGVASTYTRNLQKEDWIEKIPVDPTKFRFDIEVYVPNPDDIIIAPERVWRDNIFTYIDLGEKALTAVQRPIVTLIVERSETPVGFRSAGPNNRLIIVEGMGDMVLRSGKRIVCLKLRRADSDGLENTVYAKTNDWDLQTAYASQPEKTSGDKAEYEDVYGTSKNDDLANFFTEDAFSKPQTSGASSTRGSDASIDDALDNLPKTKPVVASQKTENVTGQYDARVGNAELITPDYNDQNINAEISYQSKSVSKEDASEEGKKLGGANPVVISASDKKTSAATDALIKEVRSNQKFDGEHDESISIELGTDENVNNLEKLWNSISRNYSATLGRYQPFYSVDAPADGQGKEVFHLRVGPVNSLDEGDNVCSQLGRNGIFCSVVRIQ